MTQVPQAAPPSAPVPVAPGGPLVRPGGLMAMAVLNFIFGGINAIVGLLALVAAAFVGAVTTGGSAVLNEAARNSGDPAAQKALQDMSAHGGQVAGLIILAALIMLVCAAMLIVSGVGYLKMKRTAGYVMGHVYAIVSIVGSILGVAGGGGFGFGTIVGLAYPVLTIALLNTSFKKYFAAAPAA